MLKCAVGDKKLSLGIIGSFLWNGIYGRFYRFLEVNYINMNVL